MSNVVLLLVTILSWQYVLASWENWTEWTSCSMTCGTGYHVRSRTCAEGTSDCAGLNVETKHCDKGVCAVDGGWGDWADWHQCSVTCGTGYKFRKRICDNPMPLNGGIACIGSENDIQMCSNSLCPADGQWSEWGVFSACIPKCGSNAVKQRLRFCNHPVPANGGADCEGSDTELQDCPYKDCLDGTWAPWGQWSQCSASCGTSVRFKLRNCTISVNNGTCQGNSYGSGICSSECPVDGGWTNWGIWSSCRSNNICGAGVQERFRTCANPSPAHGGKQCTGLSDDMRACTVPCPVNGHWSDWTLTGACSKSCGQGAQLRKRECTNPAPAHGGVQCSGSSVQNAACNEGQCPVDGQWGQWGAFGACSVTCGTGHRTKIRSCNSPAPAHGGHRCVGSSQQTKVCHIIKCPCPSATWIRHGDSCYYFSDTAHSWAYSGNWCSGYHATLVQVETAAEQHFLEHRINVKYGNATHTFWLDGEDKQQDGSWVWHKKQTRIGSYTNWYPGQPNGGTIEDCMAMLSVSSYTWYDKKCALQFLYICEKQDPHDGAVLIG